MKKILLLVLLITGLKSNGQEFVQLTDYRTKEVTSFKKINYALDGTKMDDSKVDGVYVIKKDGIFYANANFLNDRVVYLNRYSELLGKDKFSTIKEAFPNVTVNEVKKYESSATLNSSAAWFMITKLLDILPTGSTLILDGKYYVDLPIKIKRSRITIKGMDNALEIRSFLNKAMLISTNENDLIQIVDGDGKTHHLKNYVEYLTISNLHLMGNFVPGKISRYGLHFNFTTGKGTMMHCEFDNLTISNFKTGVIHSGGHINSLKFKNVLSNGNFDKGFDFIGDGANQCNAIIFEGGGASSNGYKIQNNKIAALAKNDNYSQKGGFFIKGGTALNFIGVDFTSNHGYGMNFGPSHALGCSFKFYSEANFVDFRYQNSLEASRSLDFSFYSRDNTVIFDHAAVKNKYYKD